MVGRIKLQVMGKHGWRTAYCKLDRLKLNVQRLQSFGFTVRCSSYRLTVAA